MSDLIYREHAIQLLGDAHFKNYGTAIMVIKDVPSAERTAKVKELDRRSETMMGWEGTCSNCGSYTMHEMNYCFHCGCRLEWE